MHPALLVLSFARVFTRDYEENVQFSVEVLITAKWVDPAREMDSAAHSQCAQLALD